MKSDVQTRVQRVLDRLVEQDLERGLQVAAYYHGELIVDAWAGVADASTGREVDGDTLFTVFSVGKGITATVIHLLAERGALRYDAPVAEYWPEFGRRGKERITVRQVLTHAAGVPQVPPAIGPAETPDWDQVCAAIADLAPLWEPGTQVGYHALTYGWILGEVARRITGQPFNQLVQAEICKPLGIDSLYFGIPDALEPRLATLEGDAAHQTAPLPPADSLGGLSVPARFLPLYQSFNRPEVRRACIPGANLTTNARALARHYAALAGGPHGVQLLSSEQVRIATTPQLDLVDVIAGRFIDRGLGYMLGGPCFHSTAEPHASFGHDGAGGTLGFADPINHLSFGLAKTRMVAGTVEESAAYLVTREIQAALAE